MNRILSDVTCLEWRWAWRVLLGLWLGVLAWLPAQAGYRRVGAVVPGDPMGVEVYRLDNGLTVYLSEYRETPRFTANVVVRAGSKHDPAESTGLAHYLEHMLFKGTTRLGTTDYEKERPHLDRISELYEAHFRETDEGRRRAIYEEINREAQAASAFQIPNELDKLFKLMGGEDVNAHTYQEETVYKVDLPANRLDQWALLETERFSRPVFRLFQPELEIVYEEKNRTLDSKERIIRYAVDRVLFKRHPYGQQTTIGDVAHLKNPSLKNMYAYFERHYVPGNMALVLSGDLRKGEAMRVIDRHFSAWPARPVPETPRWEEPPLSGVERVTVKYKGEEYVLLGFRLPGRNHADAEALMLMDMVLDNATAGLINLELNQRQRVRRAGSSPEFHNDHGVAYFWGVPKRGQGLAEVERLLLEQVERVKQGNFEDWIIPAIVNDFKKSQALRLESNEARVALMRDAFLAHQDWGHVVGLIQRMERLTKQDVVRVANRYFGGDYVSGYRVDEAHEVPRIEKPQLDPIEIDAGRQSEFFRRVAAMPVRDLQPQWIRPGRDYRKEEAGSGIQLYHVRNPVNRLFALEWTVDVGSRHDARLPLAARLLDKAGTRRLEAEALKKEWYRLGTDFSMTVGENQTTFALSGLDEHFAASWALMLELLREPVVATAVWEESKRILLAQREDAKKDFQTLGSALVQYNRLGANSAYLRALSNEALGRVTAEELVELVRGLTGYAHAIQYTGSLSLKELRKSLRGHLEVGAELKPAPAYRYFRAARPERTRVYWFQKELAQAQVQIESVDGEYREADQPLVELYNDYFAGGMSGIVFQELREARALAYSVGAAYVPGTWVGEENLVLGAIGCQADKTSEALAAFLGLFDDLPASPERFAEAQRSLLAGYRTGKIGFRGVLDAVRGWERLGLSGDPRPARFARVASARWEEVERFQRERVRHRSRLISVVGDAGKFDRGSLERFGDVTEVKLGDLFSF